VLVAYIFESIDLAPVSGFSGTPLNLLVALDAQGGFLDVRVLSHHEPVFLDGLGEGPLFRFVEQYRGLSLKQSIKVGGKPGDAARADSAAGAGSPAARNAARLARPAATAANTRPSGPAAASTTPNVSSAWTAWPSTPTRAAARR